MNATYDIIKEMENELCSQHRVPLYIPLIDLVKRSEKNRNEVIDDIKQLICEGKIQIRKSINDYLINTL